MNPLYNYFENNNGRLIHKWIHYFDIYDRHFNRFRNKDITVVEIGIYQGGSLQMWKNYFGAKAKIVGIDIDARCKVLEEENIRIYTGSQEDVGFLRTFKEQVAEIDIVIDDGGHTMNQMTTSFKELYDVVSENGIYVVEDLHTCYWKEYGGGYRNSSSFIEFAKGLIDQLNAWHSRDENSFSVNDFTRSTYSMHFYDSIVVFEKRAMFPPDHKMTGIASF